MNNDTVVDPAFLSGLVQAAEDFPEGAALCPKICHYDRPGVLRSTGGLMSPWTGRARQVGRDRPDEGGQERVEERDYADGSCMLIGRSALGRVGLLDEDYFAYWEEMDWCDRAREAGIMSYYVPSARIWRKGTSMFTHPGESCYLLRRNAFLFLRKRKRAYHVVTAALFHLFVRAPLYFLRHPAALGRLTTEARALLWHLTNSVRRQESSLGPRGHLEQACEGPQAMSEAVRQRRTSSLATARSFPCGGFGFVRERVEAETAKKLPRWL